MVEVSDSASLAQKTFTASLVAGKLRRQDFQRNPAIEACIFRQIDNAHAASTQFLKDAVVRDGLPNHESKA